MKSKLLLTVMIVSLTIVVMSVMITILENNQNSEASTITNSGTCGDNLTWTLDDEGLLTISGHGEMYNYNTVPSNNPWKFLVVKNVVVQESVTTIGWYAFSECRTIENVSLPSTITNVGSSSFEECTSLKSIVVDTNNPYYSSEGGVLFDHDKETLIKYPAKKDTISYEIPGTVTTVQLYAFMYCSTLKNLTIPSTVTSIGVGAFMGCNSLECIDVDNGNTAFLSDNGVLFNHSRTELIKYPVKKVGNIYNVPDSVTIIDSFAFDECSVLRTITIPDSVTNIGTCAFRNSTSLTSVEIPNSITKIEQYTFDGCTSLNSVTIPNSITNIGAYAFDECTSLPSVNIPNSVTTIGLSAFGYCRSLNNVIIPNSVTTLVGSAFSGCTSLTSIVIPNSITTIDDFTFSGCTSLSSVVIPDSVTNIKRYSFSNCTALRTITIPNSVNTIDKTAFNDCYSLETIDVDTGNTHYKSVDGVLFDYSVTTLMVYPCSKAEASYIVPSTVNTIEDYAFSNCAKLIHVTIPNSVTSLGTGIFTSTKLESVTLPGYYENIAEDSLRINQNTSVTFTKSIDSIKTILSHQTIDKIIIDSSVTTISDNAFSGIHCNETITMPGSYESIGNDIFEDSTFYQITVTGSTKSITKMISGMVHKIIIDPSVTNISSHSFDDLKIVFVEFAQRAIPITIEEQAFVNSRVAIEFDKDMPIIIETKAFENCDIQFTIKKDANITFNDNSIYYSDGLEHTVNVFAPYGYTIPANAYSENTVINYTYDSRPDNEEPPNNTLLFIVIGVAISVALAIIAIIIVRKRLSR